MECPACNGTGYTIIIEGKSSGSGLNEAIRATERPCFMGCKPPKTNGVSGNERLSGKESKGLKRRLEKRKAQHRAKMPNGGRKAKPADVDGYEATGETVSIAEWYGFDFEVTPETAAIPDDYMEPSHLKRHLRKRPK